MPPVLEIGYIDAQRLRAFPLWLWKISLNPMANGIIRNPRRELRVMAEGQALM